MYSVDDCILHDAINIDGGLEPPTYTCIRGLQQLKLHFKL